MLEQCKGQLDSGEQPYSSPVRGELEDLAMDSEVCHPGDQIADALLHLLLMLRGGTLLLLLPELHATSTDHCNTKPRHNALQYHGVMAPSFESLSHASRSLRTGQTLAEVSSPANRYGKITDSNHGDCFLM